MALLIVPFSMFQEGFLIRYITWKRPLPVEGWTSFKYHVGRLICQEENARKQYPTKQTKIGFLIRVISLLVDWREMVDESQTDPTIVQQRNLNLPKNINSRAQFVKNSFHLYRPIRFVPMIKECWLSSCKDIGRKKYAKRVDRWTRQMSGARMQPPASIDDVNIYTDSVDALSYWKFWIIEGCQRPDDVPTQTNQN